MSKAERAKKGVGLALLVVALFPLKVAFVQSPWWFVLAFFLAALGAVILLKKTGERENSEVERPERSIGRSE